MPCALLFRKICTEYVYTFNYSESINDTVSHIGVDLAMSIQLNLEPQCIGNTDSCLTNINYLNEQKLCDAPPYKKIHKLYNKLQSFRNNGK